MPITRRSFVAATGVAAFVAPFSGHPSSAETPLLTVASRTLEVNGKPAKVFGIEGRNGHRGLITNEGERFSGIVRNATADPLVMHWHGQVHAAADQDRARPNGGALAPAAQDIHDFLLTPGTHWMHSHQLTEQQLLAAPMITRERDAGDVQDIAVMLHDFAFRSPAEILSELGAANAHEAGAHGSTGSLPGGRASSPMPGHPGMNHGSMPMGGMMHGKMNHRGGGMMPSMAGMRVHANDVRYDAYLANDRTLDDPEVVRVEKGGTARLRIVNGGTATAFFIDTGALEAECIAVDGSRCQPLKSRRFPLAQGQRIDLLVRIPREGGAFPIFAQVEADRRRTGIILTTAGAAIAKLDKSALEDAPYTSLALDERLRAMTPLPERKADRTYHLMLGEEVGYRWTINGKIHGEHQSLEARVGERIEIMFMNPTMMMHPMHLHGHHFQVVGSRAGRFSGPVRDTIIVPPHTPVMVAFDADKPGAWYIHCHHLYHMATGMMTELSVS
ncbi:MAG: multicopper oxidase domain-containing protein [Beijerinckiaceae bacterium]|nr:multicopper oxidase domain-containing protein [Beijerinckiaceae bacterium]